MTAHARFSPSAAHRWMRCAGALNAEAGLPDTGQDSPYAKDGTITHLLCAIGVLEAWSKAQLQALVGVPLSRILDDAVQAGTIDFDEYADGLELVGDMELEADRAGRIWVYLDYIESRTPVRRRLVEHKVDLSSLYGVPGQFGTADCVLLLDGPDGAVLEVIDYKDGHGYVDVNDNEQLLSYAAGAAAEMGTGELAAVVCTVVQPKAGAPAVRSQALSPEELERFSLRARAAAQAAQAEDAPRSPGEKQCQWCRAKGVCAARAGQALAQAQTLFTAPVDLDTLGFAEPVALDQVRNLTPEQMGALVGVARSLKAVLSDIEDEVRRRIETGETVPGWKLVAGRRSRGWSLEGEDLVKKLKGLRLKADQIYDKAIRTPAALEKVAQFTDTQRRHFDALVKVSDGKPTLAPASDKRESLAFDAATLFGGASNGGTSPSIID